jgi:hypothetical protein
MNDKLQRIWKEAAVALETSTGILLTSEVPVMDLHVHISLPHNLILSQFNPDYTPRICFQKRITLILPS